MLSIAHYIHRILGFVGKDHTDHISNTIKLSTDDSNLSVHCTIIADVIASLRVSVTVNINTYDELSVTRSSNSYRFKAMSKAEDVTVQDILNYCPESNRVSEALHEICPHSFIGYFGHKLKTVEDIAAKVYAVITDPTLKSNCVNYLENHDCHELLLSNGNVFHRQDIKYDEDGNPLTSGIIEIATSQVSAQSDYASLTRTPEVPLTTSFRSINNPRRYLDMLLHEIELSTHCN